MPEPSKERVKSTIREWLTPSLISILGIMLWSELTELKRDVKTLLIANGSTNTKVMMLQEQIDYLRNKLDNHGYRQSAAGLPSQRATPKKEDGPKVPDPEGVGANDKKYT
jgi:hypothetical protein